MGKEFSEGFCDYRYALVCQLAETIADEAPATDEPAADAPAEEGGASE